MVTIQSSSKNGAALVKYLLEEESHRDGTERNVYVTTVNLMPGKNDDADGYIKQFRDEWTLKRENHEIEMRHMILSCTQREWLAEDEETAALEFGELVADYVREYYPHRRAIVAVQTDGKGYFVDSKGEIIRTDKGRVVRSEENARKISGEENVREEHVLHAHVALSDCDMTDAKGVEKEKTRFPFLKRTFDEFFTNRTGLEIDLGQKRGRAKYLSGQLQDENGAENDQFISYKDDIADRIDQCIAASVDMDSFYDNLPKYGLKLKAMKNGTVFHESKKHGSYVTFELVDQSRTTGGERYKNDIEVEGEMRKAGSLVKCSIRSFKFEQEGYDLVSIADRIAKHEAYVPTKKEKTEVNIHDLYMSKMRGSDESEYMTEVNAENKDYFAALKAKAEEADRKRHAGEPEEEQPKPKPYRARGYARTPDPYRQKTEEKKQDPIPEPVIEKQDAPAPMAPPEGNPMVADLMARAELLAQKQRKQRTEEADYSPLRKKPYGI